MTIMNEPLTSFGVSFALPKNSPYTDKYEKSCHKDIDIDTYLY